MKRSWHDVRVLYVDSNPERNPDGSELARDIRALGDIDLVDEEALEQVYRELTDQTSVPVATETGDPIEVLEDIHSRMEGPALSPYLNYDGTVHRSSYMGDITVLDGTPYFCARIGFEELDVDLDAVDIPEHERKLSQFNEARQE